MSYSENKKLNKKFLSPKSTYSWAKIFFLEKKLMPFVYLSSVMKCTLFAWGIKIKEWKKSSGMEEKLKTLKNWLKNGVSCDWLGGKA